MLCEFPPMGWNSWDCYGTSVTETAVRRNAEYMAKYLLEYGWEYVVVDIEWYRPSSADFSYEAFADFTMDGYGRFLPAENRFPSSAGGAGFHPLADYIHSLGLKFGIHIMRGIPRAAAHRHLPVEGSQYRCDEAADPYSICQWNPDMYGTCVDQPAAQAYYRSLFRLYTEWGVDFVKCDDIAREYPHCEREIELISQACRDCGRDIALSLSPGPAPLEHSEHLKKWANMWRLTDDFWDNWQQLKDMFERAEKWCIHAGPGHWPDADMLPIGAIRQCGTENSAGRWTRFTPEEQRTMMTLWCMLRSPLMIGGELTKNDAFTLSLLTNKPLLEIERKSYCAHPLRTTENEAVWFAPKADGKGAYVAAFNLSDNTIRITVTPYEIQMEPSNIRELWTHTEADELSACIPPHGCAVWEITR